MFLQVVWHQFLTINSRQAGLSFQLICLINLVDYFCEIVDAVVLSFVARFTGIFSERR